MAIQQPESERAFLFITAITAWLALGLQLQITMSTSSLSITETISRYFSFFTVWINLTVALCATFNCFPGKSRLYRFFSSPRTLTAIAVYITTGALIYNFILRHLWNPEGMQRVADELLHLIVPLLFLTYWVLFTPKSELRWKDLLTWLVLPLIYFLLIIINGRISGHYPYPFFDVSQLGMGHVLFNLLKVVLGFTTLGAIFISIGKFNSTEDNRSVT